MVKKNNNQMWIWVIIVLLLVAVLGYAFFKPKSTGNVISFAGASPTPSASPRASLTPTPKPSVTPVAWVCVNKYHEETVSLNSIICKKIISITGGFTTRFLVVSPPANCPEGYTRSLDNQESNNFEFLCDHAEMVATYSGKVPECDKPKCKDQDTSHPITLEGTLTKDNSCTARVVRICVPAFVPVPA